MSAVTGIVAGVVTAAGAIAVYRYAKERARRLRDQIEEARTKMGRSDGEILDFEQDPASGVYRPR